MGAPAAPEEKLRAAFGAEVVPGLEPVLVARIAYLAEPPLALFAVFARALAAARPEVSAPSSRPPDRVATPCYT